MDPPCCCCLLIFSPRGCVLGGLNNTFTKLEYRSSLGALASCVLVHMHDRGSLNTGNPRGKCFCDLRFFDRIRLRMGDDPNATFPPPPPPVDVNEATACSPDVPRLSDDGLL